MNKDNIITYLDTPQSVSQIDKENLAGILSDFPQQLSRAVADFGEIVLPLQLAQAKQVVFCGMGGSAIGAELACDLSPALKRKPLLLVRGYDLPFWVNQDTAVVIISYSGSTAEALSCFDQALKHAGTLLVISSGGELTKKAVDAKVPLYKFNYQAPPRDALGYLFAPAVNILQRAEVLKPNEADLSAAIKLLDELEQIYQPNSPTSQNQAKQLAYSLYDHIPVVVGSNITKSVARRWKNQLNEHSKTASWFDELPEANHNTVEGFRFPSRFKDDVVILILESNFDHPATVKRQALWREYLKYQGIQVEVIAAQGADIWSNKLSLVYLGDWVSYYLALLYRIDPAAIPVINDLKNKLDTN